MKFEDYFWTEADYIDCINKSNLNLEQVYSSLGKQADPFNWKDERTTLPFTIFLLTLVKGSQKAKTIKS